ncbi:MAG: histidinol dehydrogenase [archaeon]
MKIIKASELRLANTAYEQIKEIDTVREIIRDVRKNGDSAVRKYTKKFDAVVPKSFEISKKEIRAAYKQVDEKTIAALRKAAKNIKYFTKEQFKGMKNFTVNRNGVILGQKIVPIEKIGCYAPGGRYPLPSTALMCVIPAKVARVKEIIVCSPKIKPATIVAADIAGAGRIFSVGGAQAIAAMAYGTKTIPKVDKIVGPGNRFVTAAKKEVYGAVGIDFLAGPSEILIIADGSGNAKMIAADLLAQAEHDTNAKPYLVTTSRELAEKVNNEISVQLDSLGTKETAELALLNGAIIIAPSLNEAIQVSNKKAPEHLELQVKNPKRLISKLTNYGSLFIGEYSAEVFGDYCSGTNHTLPTNGAARYTGGLSVKDFVKILTYQRITKNGAKKLIPIASQLAKVEGLEGHKKSAQARDWK